MKNSFLNFVHTFYIHPVYSLCQLKKTKGNLSEVWFGWMSNLLYLYRSI